MPWREIPKKNYPMAFLANLKKVGGILFMIKIIKHFVFHSRIYHIDEV